MIVGGARTPFCEWQSGKRGDGQPGGLLKDYSALKLGEIAIKGALDKTGTAPEDVDHVVMGYALQTCDQAIFGARHAGLGAGIPQEIPMLTLSRICGSGVQAIVTGAQMIMLGEANTVIAGGMENMSQAPHVLRGMRDTHKLARPPRAGTVLEKDMEDYLFTNLLDGMCGSFMAQTSDEICKRKGITREETDQFAALSHARTANSIDSGIWEQEVVKVGDIGHKDEDHVVRGSTPESLAELRTAFGPDSLVTAGNS